MMAPRLVIAVLCLAALCLGLWTSAGSAYGNYRSSDLSTIASSISFDVQSDTWIDADTAATNYGADKELWVGMYGQGGKAYERRTLLWFDISTLPSDATVDSATLELYQTAAYDAKYLDIWPLMILDYWGEMAVTWNTQPPTTSKGDPAQSLDQAVGTKSWSVTGIVQAWRAGAKNYGIELTGDSKTLGTRVFAARENTPARLIVNYHMPVPLTSTATRTATRTLTPTPSRTPTPTPTRTPTPTWTSTVTLPPPQAFSDLGDAPDSSNSANKQMEAYPGVWANFPTVFGTGSPPIGPLHRNQPLRYWLGAYISTEFEADSGYDEDGENNLQPESGRANRDLGDDGLDLPATWEHCKPMQLTFHVNSAISEASNTRLNIWADWNGNGTWGDELLCGQSVISEWAVKNASFTIPGYGRHTFTTPAFLAYRPVGAGSFWLRVTLSDTDANATDGSGPPGGWVDGETEDYLIVGGAAPTQTWTATPTRTATPTPTATSGTINFGLQLVPTRATLDLDPVVAGEANRAQTSVQVRVTFVGGSAGLVSLNLTGGAAGVGFRFEPQQGTPPFTSVLTLWTDWPDLARPGAYDLTVVGTAGGLSRQAPLMLNVTRTLYGDLSVTSAEAVQVLESRIVNAPLVRDKATAFRAVVNSTFSRPVNAYLRLVLPAGQWTDPLLIRPPAGASASAATAPNTYPEVWGPYRIQPGQNRLWLPYVPPGLERAVRDANNPAGIISGRCWGAAYERCTIDTRYTPRPAAAQVSFTVAADPANRIPENNEGNNSYSEPGWPTIATRPWRFYFIAMTSSAGLPTRATVGVGAKHLMEYLVGAFPIAETKVSYSVSYGMAEWLTNDNRGTFLSRYLALARSEGFDYVVASTQITCGGGGTLAGVFGAMIGGACTAEGPTVLAHEFMHSTTGLPEIYSLDTLVEWDGAYCEYTSGGVVQRRYCSWSNTGTFGRSGAFCTQPDRFTPPSCSGTISKTLLVNCHCSREYAEDPTHPCTESPQIWFSIDECHSACRTACNALGGQMYGGPDNRTEHPSYAGMWVNKWVTTDSNLDYMMDSHPVDQFPRWWQTLTANRNHFDNTLMNDGWVNLTRNPNFVRATDPEALLVRGRVNVAGAATFEPFLRLPESLLDLEPGVTGAYTLRLLDDGGKVLEEMGFDLSFWQSDPYGGPTSEMPFVYRVQWVDGTRRVELRLGDKLLAARDVTANAPALALQTPGGGAYRVGSPVPVRWTASDQDGDTLSFAISLSEDDGQTWLPIALDLAGTSFDLSTAGLPAGQAYRIKVRASDGVNTTESISNPFALHAPTYLPLVRK